MRIGWTVRLCAMSVIAGVVAMHSLVGVHLGPQFSTVTGHVAGHVTGQAADQATMSGGSTGTHEADCTSNGCDSMTAAAMCAALLTMVLLATLRRRSRVWAAPTWEPRFTPAARTGRRSQWRRAPAPMQLGICRT